MGFCSYFGVHLGQIELHLAEGSLRSPEGCVLEEQKMDRRRSLGQGEISPRGCGEGRGEVTAGKGVGCLVASSGGGRVARACKGGH